MSSQWDGLLRNCGIWQGSFDTFDRDLELRRRQPSQLTLAGDSAVVELELLFWPDAFDGQRQGDPVKRIAQSFHQVDPELGFFSTGSFSRGSLFISTWSRPYAEFGFLWRDRRHRLVLLWDGSGRFDHPVLIREHRDGVDADEAPPLNAEQLLGGWRGHQTVLERDQSADDPHITPYELLVSKDVLHGLQWLPDGGAFRVPDHVCAGSGFEIEAWWCPFPGRLERIQRCYDAFGSWITSRHVLLQR
jgi:hypothetical protein